MEPQVASMSRQAASRHPPREASRSSSIDSQPQLVGKLNSDGIATLEVDTTFTKLNRGELPRSMKAALNGNRKAEMRRDSSASDSLASDASEENYDELKHDPTTVIVGAKGGGFVAEMSDSSTEAQKGKKTYQDVKSSSKSRPGPTRLKSIPVTLNRLREKGKYILTADDESLRDILKAGMERVSGFLGMYRKRKRTDFS